MVIASALAALLILSVIISFIIVRHHLKLLQSREVLLKEAVWGYINKMPLLLEILKKGEMAGLEIINLRSNIASGAYRLEERLEFLHQLQKRLSIILSQAEQNASIKAQPLFHAVHKELDEAISAIKISLNDYNYMVEKWLSLISHFWFKYLTFALKAGDFRQLQGV